MLRWWHSIAELLDVGDHTTRDSIIQLLSKSQREQQLKESENRCENERLEEAVKESWTASFKYDMTWINLHKPGKKMHSQSDPEGVGRRKSQMIRVRIKEEEEAIVDERWYEIQCEIIDGIKEERD